MPSEDNDPIWHLLARSPKPQPDAWFTVRALARCHREGPGHGLFSAGSLWRWALGGGLGVCLAIGLMVAQVQTQVQQTRVQAQVQTENVDKQKTVQEAFEIMASLNSDSDSSSSSPWQDSSL